MGSKKILFLISLCSVLLLMVATVSAQQMVSAKITAIEGQVEIQRNPSNQPVPVKIAFKVEDRLSAGDKIITGKNGRLVLGLSDGSQAVIAPKTIVVIQDLSQSPRTLFEVLKGKTRIQIENYLAGEIQPKQMSSEELEKLILATKEGGQETRAYEIEYQAKFARPFATFFAAIIAAPIGLKFARGGYIGFAISIILTFFYFVAETMGSGFGNLGLLPIHLAAWLPNIIFGVVGLFFLIQVD